MYMMGHKDTTMKWAQASRKIKGIELFNTFPSSLKFVIVIILCFIILLFVPIKVLVAEDFKDSRYLGAWKVKDQFTVSYIHSVELTEVLEMYEIEAEEINLKETYFKSYGAGLPSTTPYDFEITSDGFRIFNIDETMKTLVYRTGATRANHKLIIEDEEYNFLDFSQGQTPVHLKIENMFLIKYFVKEVLN